MRRVLFVCTGNSCRSPMAEGILRHLWQSRDQKPEGLVVESAGISAFDGGRATPQATQAMKERGIDIQGHTSRTVTRELLLQTDLIVTMTRRHKQSVLSLAPEAAGHIFALCDLADVGGDVPDPFGGDVAQYRTTADVLTQACREILQRICDGTIPEHDTNSGGTSS